MIHTDISFSALSLLRTDSSRPLTSSLKRQRPARGEYPQTPTVVQATSRLKGFTISRTELWQGTTMGDGEARAEREASEQYVGNSAIE